MSPKIAPITAGKRPPVVHYARTEGLAFCGRRGMKVWTACGERVTCSTCLRSARTWFEEERLRLAKLAALRHARERRARSCYDIWAHRALQQTPTPFDRLPVTTFQAWLEVVEYLEDELVEEDDV